MSSELAIKRTAYTIAPVLAAVGALVAVKELGLVFPIGQGSLVCEASCPSGLQQKELVRQMLAVTVAMIGLGIAGRGALQRWRADT